MREQTHTADASRALPALNGVVTMSDATPSAAGVQPASDTSNAEAKADAPKSEPAANSADSSEPIKTDIAASESVKAEEAKTNESRSTEKPAEPVKAVADTPAGPAIGPDAKKDTARPPGAEKAARTEPPKRPGQIAVFVSRKDSKLYVRENFKPQFDVPITIAPSDRPLGTHVFTVAADKNDPNLLRWSVVSLPVAARNAARIDSTDRAAQRGRMVGAAPSEVKLLPTVNSPAEALDRIAVAPDAMARIAEMLTTGSSIVVSDHGINTGGETGEGTDFIVPLRMVQP
ncbi:hypothetical protein ACF1BQ_016495 [Bradyrhizobium sp. RDT10]